MSIKVTGSKELLNVFAVYGTRAPEAVANGMYEGAQEIAELAQDRAPEKTGRMKGSIYAAEPVLGPNGSVSCDLGAGGPSSEYVARQEFDETLQHPNGGQSHFLGSSVDERAHRIPALIRKHVGEFLFTKRLNKPSKRVPTSPFEGGGP